MAGTLGLQCRLDAAYTVRMTVGRLGRTWCLSSPAVVGPSGVSSSSDAELATVNVRGDRFHPDWGYTIKPRDK